MALALDVATRFPAANDGSVDGTSGDRTFTHTPVGTPAGVVVTVGGLTATATEVSGVLYGGVSMSLEVSAIDNSEAGNVMIFFLGTGIPTGAQTVTLQNCAASSEHWAVCYTVTAATTDTAVDDTSKLDSQSGANPAVLMTTTDTTMSFAMIHSGLISPTSMTALTGCTVPFSNGADYALVGSRSGQAVRRTSADAAGSITIGCAASADDYGIAGISIKESGSPPGSTFVPQTIVIT